ncbi:ATP dependent DNA ligase domain-containing protein [Staphylotrichum tortipilum]|uniref:DNA ligase n=1 Tax=Staphylotrichum tortipilum TaxID=2831512 RepID=A0AAN6RR86_9PEZI|nr:ATP dependent DNA ligase domain-containing protein [Staphylotrichum longicolle]
MSRTKRAKSPNVDAIEEDEQQYASGPLSLAELDEHFPNRPHNHSKTPPFSHLFTYLFNPLIDCKPTTAGAAAAHPALRGRRGAGAAASSKLSYHEQRRHIIERFMSRWRADVGPDFYPAMRLILPDKDRDRGVYGLKENTIGKLLVKVMKIDRNSEDGYALMHWKLPGQGGGGGGGGSGGGGAGRVFGGSRTSAGDFAGRCYEIVGKRQMRTDPGSFTIGEVNVMLDRLAGASGEAEQLPIFEEFYQGMNAEELMWLVRIILKDMKVGATERTFLGLWHLDAEALFSVSSSLRRVCWELHDPEFRLEQQETGVTLMSCFQPQLAQFQMTTGFGKLVASLGSNDDHPEFWVEEKLDGERMQMHMQQDKTVPGGFRFGFWSRKAKEYTYLYGNGLEDDQSALTRHLKNAFDSGVRNLILDGEMITWDTELDKMVPFGTLKTAALEQQKNPFQTGPRPLYRVFDILLLNDKSLTEYTLADRHRALERAVKGEPRRLEIHPYEIATSADTVEPMLRKVVAEASEGLVLKNPRSRYQLNSRNNDWIKVKPEYMSEFGESLDCVVVGGYYGSGHRGGTLSTFLCGLRVSENFVRSGAAASREKCLSFCKVGGGLKAEDYAEIRHHTEGKWTDWDAANPPSEFIELGGGERLQYERPDVWIRPSESVVISIKAASFAPSDQFAAGWTLRFPRFRKLRLDKAWDAGMDVDECEALRTKVKQEEKDRRAMEMENRKRKPAKRQKRDLVIAGAAAGDEDETAAFLPGKKAPSASGALFQGLDFCILSEALRPRKITKPNLEKLIKDHGGRIHQTVDKSSGMILLADKNVVKVASLKKAGDADIVRPKWVLDCLEQGSSTRQPPEGYLLPFEQSHLLHATPQMAALAQENTDRYGDSFARDVGVDELRAILDGMVLPSAGEDEAHSDAGGSPFDAESFLDQLEARGHGALDGLRGFVFRRCRVCFARGEGVPLEAGALRLGNYVRFGGGVVVEDVGDESVTHVVVLGGKEETAVAEAVVAAEVRYKVASRRAVPRIVRGKWVEDCWKEGTLVDEEAYAPI